MRLVSRLGVLALLAAASVPAAAQPSAPTGAAGHWVGMIYSQGAALESPFTLTIVRDGDTYTGVTSGLNETGEVPLNTVAVKGSAVTFSVHSASAAGPVTLSGELTLEGATMAGVLTIGVGTQRQTTKLTLQRRNRRDVAQPQVQQRIGYFTGRWTFEYLGGEFPPLSAGPRSGTATFTALGEAFVRGELTADLDGKPYREEITIGFHAETYSMSFLERKPGGVEVLSVATWASPIAIKFVTAPIQADGRTWTLRRLLSVTSDVAFSVSEEYSVDGGPFQRLGSARFTRVE